MRNDPADLSDLRYGETRKQPQTNLHVNAEIVEALESLEADAFEAGVLRRKQRLHLGGGGGGGEDGGGGGGGKRRRYLRWFVLVAC